MILAKQAIIRLASCSQMASDGAKDYVHLIMADEANLSAEMGYHHAKGREGPQVNHYFKAEATEHLRISAVYE